MARKLFQFEDKNLEDASAVPIAERMRPRDLSEFVGQSKIMGRDGVLRKMMEEDRLTSTIFWGPPGTGKTTLARLIASMTAADFIAFSAVSSGIKEIRQIMEVASLMKKRDGRRTILFIDELHRFNKAQQDAFLPRVEDGTIILIGATTENPSFEVNTPLLSRCKVFVLQQLSVEEILTILDRAIADEDRGLAALKPKLNKESLEKIALYCDGDARIALSTLEMAVLTCKPSKAGVREVDDDHLTEVFGRKLVAYDKAGEEHYNIISALHKSMRNSDPDASLYWLARMLESGEDPLYIARRVVRFASEDIGLADPRALQVAMAAQQAVHFIGMPEGNLALAEAVVYMATAPKSNALYTGYDAARKDVFQTRDEPVPMAIRNPVTRLMKDVGYGEGYQYAHEYHEAATDLQCLPDSLAGKKYYQPTHRGFEKIIGERMQFLQKLKKQMKENRKKKVAKSSNGKEREGKKT